VQFAYDLVVPANTPEASPAVRRIRLVPGRMTRVMIEFRRGAHGLVLIRMLHGLVSIVPVSDSRPLFGDGVVRSVPMDYEMKDPHPELTLVGWSPGTRYDHRVTFYIDFVPAGAYEREALMRLLFGQPAAVVE